MRVCEVTEFGEPEVLRPAERRLARARARGTECAMRARD